MAQRQQIHVGPVPGALGAEISGIDLRAPIGDDLVEEIHSAFLANHVLFFRDQELDPETQAKVGSLFGELEDYPFVEPLPGHPKVIPVIKEPDETGNFGGGWHTDLIYRPQPSMATMLYAVGVPSRGGATLFAAGELAFLDQELVSAAGFCQVVGRAAADDAAADDQDLRPVLHGNCLQ